MLWNFRRSIICNCLLMTIVTSTMTDDLKGMHGEDLLTTQVTAREDLLTTKLKALDDILTTAHDDTDDLLDDTDNLYMV